MSEEERQAVCPVIWKGHATLPNGRECHTRYMRGGKVKMIMRMTSIHAPTQLIYLSGGSVYNPQQPGLGIPLEMTMALHSDAGCSKTDELIGSLGIYTTDFNNGKLNTGIDRYASRDLADILLTQIQKDIYSSYNLSWTRRSMWNRNYARRVFPATPSTITNYFPIRTLPICSWDMIRISSLRWDVPSIKVSCSLLPASMTKNM